jgi:hypothetical protein
MNRLLSLIAVAVTIVVAGCLTPTHYQPTKEGEGGFWDRQVGWNQFEVIFAANGATTQQQAADFAVLRASDIGIRRGYRYMVVDNVNNQSSRNTVPITFPGRTTGSAFAANGWTTFNATTTPPTTIDYTIVLPSFRYLVTFHHTIPVTFKNVYDVYKLRDEMCQKYRLSPDKLPGYVNPSVVNKKQVG